MSYVEAEPADLVAGPLASVSASSRPEHVPSRLRNMRIAIVHEWLETFAGSESVLEQLLLCFPNADLFAVVDFLKPEDRRFLAGRTVKTSFIQRLPAAKRMFRSYLGLMPLAVEQFDMAGYDIIISSNHAVAKGVLTGPDQIHISYVHSPMRYIWDLQHQYLRQSGLRWGLKAIYTRWLFGRLRQWDVSSAQHVDHFIANSSYIGRRLKKAYARDATVIHPPVDVEHFGLGAQKDDFFLLAGRLVPYKRADLIVESFRMQPDRKLIVVGRKPLACAQPPKVPRTSSSGAKSARRSWSTLCSAPAQPCSALRRISALPWSKHRPAEHRSSPSGVAASPTSSIRTTSRRQACCSSVRRSSPF
jgi:glycosyltransferase involved in cell wall biosynthesis